MVYRSFVWRDPVLDVSTQFHVVTVPASRVKADVWFQQTGIGAEDALTLSEVGDQHAPLVAINGGYFTHEFLPAGLARSDGVELAALSQERVQSGIVAIDSDAAVRLQARDTALHDVADAIQAGPFLIDPGGELGIYSDDRLYQRRSVIAVARDGQLVLLTADTISLYQLAQLMHRRPGLFGVSSFDRALNLDGGPSTTLYLGDPNNETITRATGPVHNFILFYER